MEERWDWREPNGRRRWSAKGVVVEEEALSVYEKDKKRSARQHD